MKLNRRLTLGVRLIVAAALTAVLASCTEKDLCYDHAHRAPVEIAVDWSRFTVETPTGMSVMLYPHTDGEAQTLLTNHTGGVVTSLLSDTYTALVYNQSPSEFATLVFTDMQQYDAARVNAAPKTSRWYHTRDASEQIVQNPEWIGEDAATGVEVTRAMTASGDTALVARLQPRNIVYTIRVAIHLSNIYNFRSVRASLDGLADGYVFSRHTPTATVATQLIENWTIVPDADNPVNGTVWAEIQSFGLPAGHEGRAGDNRLNLSLLLVDTHTQIDRTICVGDLFRPDDDTELTLTVDERVDTPLPDVKPDGGTAGGFDVSVDDWGDDTQVDLDV